MKDWLTIELKDLEFHGYHGLYAEEKKLGNFFRLDLKVSYLPNAGIITDLSDTIDYVQLYSIVCKEMSRPRELLETLAMELIEAVHAAFPTIKNASVTIAKLHPPIPSFEGQVSVSFSRDYTL